MKTNTIISRKLQAITALIILFVIDFFVPLGVATGALYLLCFLLIIKEDKNTILTFLILTSSATLIKLLFFYESNTIEFAVTNRVISLFAHIIATLIVLKYKKLNSTINQERVNYISDLKVVLNDVNHKIRKPSGNLKSLISLLEERKNLSDEELKNIISHLKTSTNELDNFTKELESFLQESKNRTINKKTNEH